MTTQNGRAFNEWLRAQLKAKKMSQRQLAQQSGVDHSTISRLIRGDRMPSLGTATKLARGLRELRDDADTPQYLGLVAAGNTNPTARVEYALRADELLSEPQVRQIMEYYLAVRMRRYGRSFQPAETEHQRRSGACSAQRPHVHLGEPGRCRGRVHRQHGAPGVTLRHPGARALLAHIRARPGFALHDPGLGAANAGVWGAGVRDSRELGRRAGIATALDVPVRHAIERLSVVDLGFVRSCQFGRRRRSNIRDVCLGGTSPRLVRARESRREPSQSAGADHATTPGR